MKTKIFCDIAEINLIKKFNKKKIVKGFTTNPSLMRKAGAKSYEAYSKQILKYPQTNVKAMDRDKVIIDIAKKLEKNYKDRFIFYQKKFSEVDTVVKKKKVDAVIFDLGLSSIQLKDFKRDILKLSYGNKKHYLIKII